MLNKKLLAAAIGAALSTSAYATVDLDSNDSQIVRFASESINATDGMFTATNDSSLLDFQVEFGFGVQAGDTAVVRIDLENAEFATGLLAGNLSENGAADVTFTVLSDGDAGDNVAFIQLAVATADLEDDDVLTIALPDLSLDAEDSANISYGLYINSAAAANEDNPLSTASALFTAIADANTGEFAIEGEAVATVDSQFTDFEAPGGGLGVVGEIDGDELLASGTFFAPDGMAAALVDIVDSIDQGVTIEGDFSFGDAWFLALDAVCSTGGSIDLDIADDMDSATSDGDISLTVDRYLCVSNPDDDTASRGSYVATLEDEEISDTVGVITFDTTSIEIPFLSTFSGYNQRVIIINEGNNPAAYTTSFITETGVTATPGDAAEGTVPAGEILVISASNMVTLEGRTRAAATIEIEASADDVIASTQVVNLEDASTDTVTLVVRD